MSTISLPRTNVRKLPATLSASLDPQKILFVGQKASIGTATPGALYESVSEGDIIGKFGYKSILGAMLDSSFKEQKDVGSSLLPQVDVIALDDNGSTYATSTLTISEKGGATGLATVAGTIYVIIGSEEKHTYEIPVTVGQLIHTGAGSVAEEITDAINEDVKSLVTAANVAGVITLTFNNAGSVGNGTTVKVIGLEYDGADYVLGNIQGVTTAFVGGATDPVMTTVLDVVGTNRYQTIVYPSQYGDDWVVDDFLDTRWNVDNAILDGVGITTKTDTYANINIYLATRNTQNEVCICNELVNEDLYKGNQAKEYDFATSAMVGTIRAIRRTEGANILRITPAATNSPLDGEGGVHISSLPYFNTPLYNLPIQDTNVGWSAIEILAINANGGTCIGSNVTGTNILLGEVLTTYKTDALGNSDESFKFLNYVDSLSAGAEYQFANLKKDLPQHRLTTGNVRAGYAMVNKEAFENLMIKYYLDLADMLIVDGSKEALAYYKDTLSTNIDMLTGKITNTNNLSILTQLREMLVYTKLNFGG